MSSPPKARFSTGVSAVKNGPQFQKAAILISFLQDKITTSGTATEPLYNTDNKAWVKIPMAIGTIYGEIGQLAKQIEICEGLIEKQEDKTNMSPQHALAWLLNQRGDAGDFAKVEEIKRPCTKYMDERVGKGSPQSMSSRRIMAKAVWMQGRIGEAKTLIDELFELIRETRKGKFAVYEESERMMTEEMMEELLKLKPE